MKATYQAETNTARETVTLIKKSGYFGMILCRDASGKLFDAFPEQLAPANSLEYDLYDGKDFAAELNALPS